MFTCERCGVNSADGFIMLDGTWLCKACVMPMDNVDQHSLSAVSQAKTVQEKIDAWRNCNGIALNSPSGWLWHCCCNSQQSSKYKMRLPQ